MIDTAEKPVPSPLSFISTLSPYHYGQSLDADHYLLPSRNRLPNHEAMCSCLGPNRLMGSCLGKLQPTWRLLCAAPPAPGVRRGRAHFCCSVRGAQNSAFLVPLTFLSRCSSLKCDVLFLCCFSSPFCKNLR